MDKTSAEDADYKEKSVFFFFRFCRKTKTKQYVFKESFMRLFFILKRRNINAA